MIVTLGLMVSVYAIARLLQVPMDMYAKGSARWVIAAIISGLAIAAIGLLAVDLLLGASNASLPSTM